MIAKTLPLLIGLAALSAAPSCKKKDAGDKPASEAKDEKSSDDPALGKRRSGTAHGKSAKEVGDPVGDAHKDGMQPKVTLLALADYEPMMLNLKGCALEGIEISNGCPAARQLATARRTAKLGDGVSSLVAKHIKHPAEPVRVHAASLIRSFRRGGGVPLEPVLNAAKTEESPAVLAQVARALQSVVDTNPGAAKLLLHLASHDSPLVRERAAKALVSRQAKAVDGSIEKVIDIVLKDADTNVRTATCRDIGLRVDDRVLPALATLIADETAAKKPRLYSACWLGLAQMIVGRPHFDKSSEKALELFTKTLAETRCSKEVPPWQVLNDIASITAPKLKPIAPWIEKRLPALHDALAHVASCRDANKLARSAALSALGKTGAPAAVMNGLKKALKSAKGDEAAAGLLQRIESVKR